MNIAIVGWGSLIWCNKALKLASKWHTDGAWLPIEFARISNDKRLTLVVVNKGDVAKQQTLWALSDYKEIDAARENLASREGTSIKNIQLWQSDKQEPFDQTDRRRSN